MPKTMGFVRFQSGVKALGWKDVERTSQTGYGFVAVGNVRLPLACSICSDLEVRAKEEQIKQTRSIFL
jgi:hypothetical protein